MEVIEAHQKVSKSTDESLFTTMLTSIAYRNKLCDLLSVFLEFITFVETTSL